MTLFRKRGIEVNKKKNVFSTVLNINVLKHRLNVFKQRLNVFKQRLNTQKTRAQDFYVERALYKRRV